MEYENDKDSLLYRPELSPGRNYRSEADFRAEGQIDAVDPKNIPIVENEVDHSPAAILEKLEQVKEAFQFLPRELHYLADEIVQKLIDRIKIITPEGKTIYSDIQPEKYVPETEETTNTTFIDDQSFMKNESLIGLPELFPETVPINLTLEHPKTLVQLAQSDYENDQLRLDEFYALKLQLTMQEYAQKMIMAVTDCGAGDISHLTEDFDGDSVKIPPGINLEHCRDFIVRSQISRKQKNMMIKKTHNVDETLKHLRAWQAAAQQRKRYYEEQYKDSESFTDSHSNALLRAQRKKYDEAYKDATYNMYKYLNSSAILIGDVLDDSAREGQAKGMLLKNGVNIYETSETKEAAKVIAEEKKQEAENKAEKTDKDNPGKEQENDDHEDEKHSHGQAPNGKYYTNNDWDYLKSTGNYSDEEIKSILDSCDKYKKNEDYTDSTTDNNSSNTKIEDVSKKKEPFIKIDKDILEKTAEDYVLNLADNLTDKITDILK